MRGAWQYDRRGRAVRWSTDLCANVLDDKMFEAVSKKAGAGRKKAFCRIDLWQSEVDE